MSKKKQNKNNGYTWKIQLWEHQREILSIFPKRGCWWKSISEYFLWLFFFLHAEKCNLFNDRFFFGKKFCCFFLTKTHFFCKSIQASCLCSNIYCNSSSQEPLIFFPSSHLDHPWRSPKYLYSATYSVALKCCYSGSFLFCLFFFRLHHLSSYRFTLNISPLQSSVLKNTLTNSTTICSDWLEHCLKTQRWEIIILRDSLKMKTYHKSPFGSVLSDAENSQKGSTQNVIWIIES